MATVTASIKRHPLVVFVALTFAPWPFIFPLASVDPMLPVFLLTFVPAPAAMLVVALTEGRAGLKALLQRAAIWRVGLNGYAAAIGLPMAIGLIAVGIGVLLGVPTATQIRSFTPIFLIMPVFALGEELGWRGYLLPRLMERRSALAATLIVIAIWGAWHAPLYLSGHIWFGLPIAQILAIPPYAILLTWVYQHTKGSVLIAALLHGAMNVASMTFYAGLGNLGLWLLATLFGLAALAVIWLTGPNLVRQPATGTPALRSAL